MPLSSRAFRGTAGVVTSAAIVMAVAAVFGTLPQLSMKEAGVGMSAAVLIDATLVRVVLLPAASAAARRRELVPTRLARRLPAPSFEEPAQALSAEEVPDVATSPV